VKITIQLAIIEDFKKLPPRAMARTDFKDYLAIRRDVWDAPVSFDVEALISLLLENDLLRIAEISSELYGRKSRYLWAPFLLCNWHVPSPRNPIFRMERPFTFMVSPH
jgi:hypothetical protein